MREITANIYREQINYSGNKKWDVSIEGKKWASFDTKQQAQNWAKTKLPYYYMDSSSGMPKHSNEKLWKVKIKVFE